MHRLLLLFLCLIPFVSHAADTRGLRVVAKDPATNQTAEVKLYNKSYAVVIGIDRYKNLSPDRQLKNAVKDAGGIEATIRKQYRFDRIFTLHDEQATRDNIMRLLTAELPKVIGKEDALFIFWAGHGNQEKTDDGDLGYLIPYDGNSDGIYGNITMSQLKDDISRAIPAKHIFYAFDACYSGLLTTRGVDAKASRNLAYLKTITKERVRQVLTAGSKGQEALDGGPRGHSVFTGRLIEVLEATGDYITANEIQSILKERVYQDARARGHEQTPGFGALYGGGDFVFVPNIEQKVQDNRVELARIEAELKQLELQEAEARKYQTEQQQREAEQRRKSAEARLKAEQLRQQQLQEEARQQQKMLTEKVRFDAEQSRREQELSTARKAEEQRIAALKAELAKKKQTVPSAATSSLAAAVAEIKRLNAEIEGIEAVFNRELEAGKKRIASRYTTEIATVKQASKLPQMPLVRDEFESVNEFKERQAKYEQRFDGQIEKLTLQQQQELEELHKKVQATQQEQTKELRQAMQQLANKQFVIGAESLIAELGVYDADRQYFPVIINSKIPEVKLAMNGTIPLPRDAARKFKQDWQAGAVRPQVVAKAGSGELQQVALVNDSNGTVLECWAGSCLTAIYTDPATGLQWLRNGNLAGKQMNWATAMQWVKTVRVGGFSDWRLPTKEELTSIAERGGTSPAEWLNTNGFINVQSDYYWSSSTVANDRVNAWDVYMGNGNVFNYNKTDVNFVWPVRGGQ